MAARSQPPECAGKGEGKGRARPLLLPLLLLLLLRRRRLGAVCSAPRGSRSPRNAHTLNRYIVDIRR
ncbi:hypothetical protein H8959_009633 [Pygathrix nigripes]